MDEKDENVQFGMGKSEFNITDKPGLKAVVIVKENAAIKEKAGTLYQDTGK